MCPKALQEHIGLNQNRPAKYEDVRNEIFTYLETKQDTQRPTPMDVDSWDYDKDGKGKGKNGFQLLGKGKDGCSSYSGSQKGVGSKVC